MSFKAKFFIFGLFITGVFLIGLGQVFPFLEKSTFVLGGVNLLMACVIYLLHRPKYIVRLKGLKWTVEDFCRGWIITGKTGSGKTLSGINNLLWQVSTNVPNWGGLCIDIKGIFWRTLKKITAKIRRANDLILLEFAEGKGIPEVRLNLLDIDIPHSTIAKIISNTSSVFGQEGQGFFTAQAQMHIEKALDVLKIIGKEYYNLEFCYHFLTDIDRMKEVLAELYEKNPKSELYDHFTKKYLKQPAEQLGGVIHSIGNQLLPFTAPFVAKTFCRDSTVNFSDMDKGKIFCVSSLPEYPNEQQYINSFLKLAYYIHVLKRTKEKADNIQEANLLVLWADEAQEFVTSNVSVISDIKAVGVMREGKATVVAATQSYKSLTPFMGGRDNSDIFLLNMTNRITFTAADEEGAKIAADSLGKKKTKQESKTFSSNNSSQTVSLQKAHILDPDDFRKLKKFHAVIQHTEGAWKKCKINPLFF